MSACVRTLHKALSDWACSGKSICCHVASDTPGANLESDGGKAPSEADLDDEVLVSNLAGMCMKEKLARGQHSASACCILPPM